MCYFITTQTFSLTKYIPSTLIEKIGYTMTQILAVYSHTWHDESSTRKPRRSAAEARGQRPGAARIAVASVIRLLLQANGTEKAQAPTPPPGLSTIRRPPPVSSSSPSAPLHPLPLPVSSPLHGSAGSLGCPRRRHVRGGGEPGARRPPRPLRQGHPEGAA